MKRILMICFVVLLLCQATAFAKHNMPEEEFCIGGLTPGCTFGYVKSIYGEPSKKDWQEDWSHAKVPHYYLTYDYAPSLLVTGLPREKSLQGELETTVQYITIKDNSLSTPSGLTVGMSYQTVMDMFGEGRKRSYNGETWYSYRMPRSAFAMLFFVDGEGKITKIRIENVA